MSVKSDAERCLSLPTDSYPHARAANLSHLSRVSSVDQRLQACWLGSLVACLRRTKSEEVVLCTDS